jgi:hypothetical protein
LLGGDPAAGRLLVEQDLRKEVEEEMEKEEEEAEVEEEEEEDFTELFKFVVVQSHVFPIGLSTFGSLGDGETSIQDKSQFLGRGS